MSGTYGLAILLFLFILIRIITPFADIQIRGWRRARKQEKTSLPLLSDAATVFGFVLVMALAGAGGWFIFARAVIEGGKVVGLAVIFVDIVPMMLGAILSVSSNRRLPAAS